MVCTQCITRREDHDFFNVGTLISTTNIQILAEACLQKKRHSIGTERCLSLGSQRQIKIFADNVTFQSPSRGLAPGLQKGKHLDREGRAVETTKRTLIF